MGMERAERIGLGLAALGHILLFGLLSLGALEAERPDFSPKPVEITIATETAPEATAPIAAPTAPAAAPATPDEPEQAEPDISPPVRQPLPPPAERRPPPAPAPPASSTAPAPRAKAPDRPAPPAASRPAPARKTPAAPPRKSRLDSSILAGLGTDPASKQPAASAPKADAAVRSRITVSIGAEIRPHWQRSAPTGVDIEKLFAVVELRLTRDGGLAATPRCAEQGGETPSNANQVALFCERAIRAARLAAPYTLPPEYYDDWKVHRVTFRLNKVS